MDNIRITEFDRDRADALRRIWFVGDVHGEFKYLAQTLLQAQLRPRWIVFVGDIDIFHKSFKEILEPLRRFDPHLKIAFIHGNHDADSRLGFDAIGLRYCQIKNGLGEEIFEGVAEYLEASVQR